MFSLSMRSILALAAFSIAATCQAGTVTAHLDSAYNNGNVQVGYNIPGHVDANYNYAGPITWTRTGGDYPINGATGLAISAQFQTFCIEINQNVNFGGTFTYNVVPLNQLVPAAPAVMNLEKAIAIQKLFNGVFSTQLTGNNTLHDQRVYAALQLTIWEIEYDGVATGGFGNGTFIGTNGTNGATFAPELGLGNGNQNNVVELADYYIGQVIASTPGVGPWGITANVLALSSTDPTALAQDQVLMFGGTGLTAENATPEPTSLCLAGIGGLAFSVVGYRRRKAAQKLS